MATIGLTSSNIYFKVGLRGKRCTTLLGTEFSTDTLYCLVLVACSTGWGGLRPMMHNME